MSKKYGLLNDEEFDFKKELFKYLFYWKFFALSTLLFLFISFIYLRYTPKVFETNAKIKIIDKKESSLELPTASEIFSHSKINLENEIEVLKSFPILSQVVKNLNLEVSVYAIGNIMESLSTNYPFKIKLKFPIKDLKNLKYKLTVVEGGFKIIDLRKDQIEYIFKGVSTTNTSHKLPFDILNFDSSLIPDDEKGYSIVFQSNYDVVSYLKNKIQVVQVGRESDIVQISIKHENKIFSQDLLNELINVFDNDGVRDRQLIHQRTIDFVNERYSFLSSELDSIEVKKEIYKVENNLVDLSANSEISLKQSIKSEEDIFKLENQISLVNLLNKTLKNEKLELLPANIGIENPEINIIINEYNEAILEQKKLVSNAGSNNPSLRQINNNITDMRSNIIFSLENYLSQLSDIKKKLKSQFYMYDTRISSLPKKEKILREIERNQTIKEALYLFLLQKREEAEVSYAVTEPSIKIVERAISSYNASSPNRKVIFLMGGFLGLIIPFIGLFLMFYFNNKIYNKNQIIDLNIGAPVVGEIPEVKDELYSTISSSKDRSPLAESFRVFASNLKYLINDEKYSKVFLVTSTIKGEGKTFCAINTAYTLSSLGKKVLLIGADMHNPQIHTYLNIEKNTDGLSSYLVNDKFDWKSSLLKPDSEIDCDILIGGKIPPNPAELLNNGNFEKLLNDAKKIYDYIIIDTPPCLLVSDTLSITRLADLNLFVVRCNYTNKDILQFIKDAIDDKKISSVGILLNGLGAADKYGYGYAYNYSYTYKYGYQYNYNYGYGYGYDEDRDS